VGEDAATVEGEKDGLDGLVCGEAVVGEADDGGGRENEEEGVERTAEAEEEEERGDPRGEDDEPSEASPDGPRLRLLTRFLRASSSLAFRASSLFCASSIFFSAS
jgi:hypothetical protein